MRVISGKAKGTGLFSPSGKAVRPTSDFVKENLFNIIGLDVVGARFLDAFAGSGGVGIEALSRGAKHVTFIDASQKSIDLVRRNLEKTRLGGDAIVLKGEMPNVLKKLAGQEFDIIFLDPPYFEGFAASALGAIVENGILSEGGQIILEVSEFSEDAVHPALEIFKEKIYGNSKLIFFEMLDPATSAE